MADDVDWLYRPVDAGYCRMESLYDGTLDICQIAEANEVLDVREENERRARAASRAQQG